MEHPLFNGGLFPKKMMILVLKQPKNTLEIAFLDAFQYWNSNLVSNYYFSPPFSRHCTVLVQIYLPLYQQLICRKSNAESQHSYSEHKFCQETTGYPTRVVDSKSIFVTISWDTDNQHRRSERSLSWTLKHKIVSTMRVWFLGRKLHSLVQASLPELRYAHENRQKSRLWRTKMGWVLLISIK